MRAPRQPAGRRREPRRCERLARWLLIAAAEIAVLPASGQQEESPTTLTGTLRKARESGAITIAYRTSSIPFSYLSSRGEPIGYSIELCRKIVEAMSAIVGPSQRVCSRPTLVSTCTREGMTLVAS